MKEQTYRHLKDIFRDTDTRTLMSHLKRTKIHGTSMEKLIIEELYRRNPHANINGKVVK